MLLQIYCGIHEYCSWVFKCWIWTCLCPVSTLFSRRNSGAIFSILWEIYFCKKLLHEHGQKLCGILNFWNFSIFFICNKKSNEHEIQAVTVCYHSGKLGVSIFFKKSVYFVVNKENMLFCLTGCEEHNREAIKIIWIKT